MMSNVSGPPRFTTVTHFDTGKIIFLENKKM